MMRCAVKFSRKLKAQISIVSAIFRSHLDFGLIWFRILLASAVGCCLSGCNLFTKLNWLNEIGHNLVNSFRFLCGKRLSYDAELCVRLTHFGALQVTTTTKLNGKNRVRGKNVFSKYLLINLSKTRRLNRCLPPYTPSFRKYSVWYQRWHKDDKFRPFCH